MSHRAPTESCYIQMSHRLVCWFVKLPLGLLIQHVLCIQNYFKIIYTGLSNQLDNLAHACVQLAINIGFYLQQVLGIHNSFEMLFLRKKKPTP